MRAKNTPKEDMEKLGFIVDGSPLDGTCNPGSAPCLCPADKALPEGIAPLNYKNCFNSLNNPDSSITLKTLSLLDLAHFKGLRREGITRMLQSSKIVVCGSHSS